MISEQDLDAFGYYEQVEAHQAAAMSMVEKTVRLQNETMIASVVAFEMALDFAFAPMKAAMAMSEAQPAALAVNPAQALYPQARGRNICL